MKWLALAFLLTVTGCGQPGDPGRPYCAVCDATGLCKYTPSEREADAEKKAAFWGAGQSYQPVSGGIPPMPPLPTMRTMP